MQITLNHEEIVAALEAHARKLINIASGNTLQIELKAGRGENGYSATLDIVPDTVVPAKPTTPIKRAVEPVVETTPEVAQEVVDEPVGVEAEPEPEVSDEDDEAFVDDYMSDNQKRTSLFAK